MELSAAVIGEPKRGLDKKNFNLKLRVVLGGQYKLKVTRLPTLEKCLDKVLSEKFSLIIIHEDMTHKATIGEQVLDYHEILYRGLIKIKTGVMQIRGKEIRSANKDTPVVILYKELNDERVIRYNRAGANLSMSYREEDFVDKFIHVLDQFVGKG